MDNMSGSRGAIAYEDNTMRRLKEDGWKGTAETLRTLAKLGAQLRKRYEASCSYPYATTDAYYANTERLEQRIRNMAESAGLRIFLQTDPRGATVYVCGPNGNMTDRNYSTMGECLYRK